MDELREGRDHRGRGERTPVHSVHENLASSKLRASRLAPRSNSETDGGGFMVQPECYPRGTSALRRSWRREYRDDESLSTRNLSKQVADDDCGWNSVRRLDLQFWIFLSKHSQEKDKSLQFLPNH